MNAPAGPHTDPGAALAALSARLGHPGFDWALCEEQWFIECEFEGIPQPVIAGLVPDVFQTCLDAYGPGVAVCEFIFGDMRELDCTTRITQPDLDALATRMAKTDTLTFRFHLDKHRLLAHWYGDPSPHAVRYLYLFAEAFTRFLQLSALYDLEVLWAGEPARKVLVFLPGTSHTCAGPLLAVLGQDDVHTWPSYVEQPGIDLDSIHKIAAIRREFVSWEKPWVDSLTPLHLCMTKLPESSISRLLAAHWMNSILIYTAGRVSGGEKPVVAAYTGTQHAIRVRLLESAGDTSEKFPVENCARMHKIWEWVYEPDFAPDRLPFVQIVVAQYLQAAGETFRCAHFIRNASDILDGLKWHWQAFVERKIDGYAAQVRALEEYVDATVDAYTGQVSELIGSLSATALTAVATVLGTFIASLFGDRTSPILVAWVLGLYAAYVYVFPFKFKLSSLVEQFDITSNGFKARCAEFSRYLYRERVEEIVGERVKSSQDRFRKWIQSVKTTYIVLIVLALLTAFTAVSLEFLRLLTRALF